MTVSWRNILSSCSEWSRFRESFRSGHQVHAYLFECGGSHAGAFFARSFARLLNCVEEDGPCETCTPCVQVGRGSFPGLTEVWPLGTTVSIGQTRGMIRDSTVRFGSGIRRVMVLYGADRLMTEAANSLLKLLEEPVSQVTLVLLAESADAVLPTIRSRCQILKFSRLDLERVGTQLGFEESARELLPLTMDLTLGNPEAALALPSDLAAVLATGEGDYDSLLEPAPTLGSLGLDLTLPLDHIFSAGYVLGTARQLAFSMARLVESGSRGAAMRLGDRLGDLCDGIAKLSTKEVARRNKELKERFQQDVHHPLLADEKKFLGRVAEVHGTLVLRLMVRILWMAVRESTGRPESCARYLGIEPAVSTLASVGTTLAAARARRIDQLKGMIWANVSLQHILDEVVQTLVDPEESLPTGISPFGPGTDSSMAMEGSF